MKILVTGGYGFVGSNLCRSLHKKGHAVHILDDLSSGDIANVDVPHTAYIYDVSEFDVSQFTDRFDVIYHLAAKARIQPSISEPYACARTNVLGTVNVLELARLHECPIVFASTSSRQAGECATPYTWSKIASEGAVRTYCNVYGTKAAICVFYNVYGPNEPIEGEYATVVAKFMRQRLCGEPMTIVGNGEQRRAFTHVSDICKGLELAATKADVLCPVYHFGHSDTHSINELAQMWGGDKIYVPKRIGEADVVKCDQTDTSAELGWSPSIGLPDYVAQRRTYYGI